MSKSHAELAQQIAKDLALNLGLEICPVKVGGDADEKVVAVIEATLKAHQPAPLIHDPDLGVLCSRCGAPLNNTWAPGSRPRTVCEPCLSVDPYPKR